MVPTHPSSESPGETVRLFLVDRDAPCPRCGYNLRGVQEPLCPECGRAIELTIARPDRSRGYLLFVLLAFGWIFAAGVMNAARAWDRVRLEATPGVRTIATLTRARISGPPVQTVWSGSQSTTITLSARGGFTIATTPGAAGTNWSGVSTPSWIALGGWSGAAILALAGLAAAVAMRRRFAGEAPPRRLIRAAYISIALYAGYHAVVFAREFTI